MSARIIQEDERGLDLHAKLVDAGAELERMENALMVANDKVRNLTEERDRLRAELERAKSVGINLNAALDEAQKEIANLNDGLAVERSKLKTWEGDLKQAEATCADLRKERDELIARKVEDAGIIEVLESRAKALLECVEKAKKLCNLPNYPMANDSVFKELKKALAALDGAHNGP